MNLFDEEYFLEDLKNRGTGGDKFFDEVEIRHCFFDKYEIDVILSSSKKFLGIRDITINKDFLSHEQKMHSQGYYDDSEYYQE